MERADDLVMGETLAHIMRVGIGNEPEDRSLEVKQALADLRQNRQAIQRERYISGTMDAESYAELTSVIDGRISELEDELRRLQKPSKLAGPEQFILDLQRLSEPEYRAPSWSRPSSVSTSYQSPRGTSARPGSTRAGCGSPGAYPSQPSRQRTRSMSVRTGR